MVGRVVKGIGGFYYVHDGEKTYMGKARGNLKRNKSLIYVGDIVDYDVDSNEECVINKVVKRENFMIRPPVSNIEMLVVVFAAANPDVNYPVIDKLIAACESRDIEVAVCITKKDLVSEDKLQEMVSVYSELYPTVTVNGATGEGIDSLEDIIKGKNVALAGPSGVGKSTMTNLLHETADAETGAISDKTQRGKHTTRHVEIFSLDNGTFLYDTPGFTSVEMYEMEAADVKGLFPEFRARLGECKYSNCLHINEPECSVKEALAAGEIKQSRYDSYLMMIDEVKKTRY